jgi:hypothetical protein
MEVMMADSASSGGIGFFGLLTILFVALKLTGYIDWSWAWVLAPVWMPICIVFLIIIGIALIATRQKG